MLLAEFIECSKCSWSALEIRTQFKVVFLELEIFAVCINDFKNWFWHSSRIYGTAITKKDLFREIVQIGRQKDFDPIVIDKAPADVAAGNIIERKKNMLFPFSFIHWFLTCQLFNAFFFLMPWLLKMKLIHNSNCMKERKK